MKALVNHLRWWAALWLCEVAIFCLTLPALLFMGLVKTTHRGADRAELELERARATRRTRHLQRTNRIQSWKKPL